MLYIWAYGYIIAFALYVFNWENLKEVLKIDGIGVSNKEFLIMISIASIFSWVLVIVYIIEIIYNLIKR